jgi:alpha-1,2-glucosyltransferase
LKVSLKGVHVAGIILLLAGVGSWLVGGEPYFEDESHHYAQVRRFLLGNTSELRSTMVPGYHVVLATFARLTGIESLDAMRRLTLVFSLLSALVFHACAVRLTPAAASARTLQYFALPILFPLFFMVHTDSLHLLLLLLSVWAYAGNRFRLAGAMVGLSLLVRQSNVIWAAMLFLMIYVDQNFDRSSDQDADRNVDRHRILPVRHAIASHLRHCWVFVIGFVGFGAFVAWNGGIAVGVFRDQHQAWPPSGGNVFFGMMVLCFLLLPSHFGRVSAIRDRVREYPLILLAVAAVLAAFMLDFAADHHWNVNEPWYLRNRLLADRQLKLGFWQCPITRDSVE